MKLRHYRMPPGFWGLGFTRSPSHWHIEIGPWCWSNEVEIK